MSPDSDLQRPGAGANAEGSTPNRQGNGGAQSGSQTEALGSSETGNSGAGSGAQKSSDGRTNGSDAKSVAGRNGATPGLKAEDRGGPGSWIDAPIASARSADGISRTDRRIARALGWFSFGLGIPQVLMPGRVARIAGLENTLGKRQVIRIIGLREIGAGVGIFTSQPKPAEWLWARVAGDVMDIGLLQLALANPNTRKGRWLFATANVLGVTALDLMEAKKHTQAVKGSGEGMGLKGRTAITVNKPAEDVYGYWHQFENLPTFMFHLESVTKRGDNLYHWVAKAPLGRKVEWDAEVVEDLPNQLIRWRSTEDADVPNSGSVRFAPAPGNRGTEVIVEIDYQLPGGAIGDSVARMFGEEPQQQMKDDLRRFKQVLETGEVVRSEGSPEGTNAPGQLTPRPAQPLP